MLFEPIFLYEKSLLKSPLVCCRHTQVGRRALEVMALKEKKKRPPKATVGDFRALTLLSNCSTKGKQSQKQTCSELLRAHLGRNYEAERERVAGAAASDLFVSQDKHFILALREMAPQFTWNNFTRAALEGEFLTVERLLKLYQNSEMEELKTEERNEVMKVVEEVSDKDRPAYQCLHCFKSKEKAAIFGSIIKDFASDWTLMRSPVTRCGNAAVASEKFLAETERREVYLMVTNTANRIARDFTRQTVKDVREASNQPRAYRQTLRDESHKGAAGGLVPRCVCHHGATPTAEALEAEFMPLLLLEKAKLLGEYNIRKDLRKMNEAEALAFKKKYEDLARLQDRLEKLHDDGEEADEAEEAAKDLWNHAAMQSLHHNYLTFLKNPRSDHDSGVIKSEDLPRVLRYHDCVAGDTAEELLVRKVSRDPVHASREERADAAKELVRCAMARSTYWSGAWREAFIGKEPHLEQACTLTKLEERALRNEEVATHLGCEAVDVGNACAEQAPGTGKTNVIATDLLASLRHGPKRAKYLYVANARAIVDATIQDICVALSGVEDIDIYVHGCSPPLVCPRWCHEALETDEADEPEADEAEAEAESSDARRTFFELLPCHCIKDFTGTALCEADILVGLGVRNPKTHLLRQRILQFEWIALDERSITQSWTETTVPKRFEFVKMPVDVRPKPPEGLDLAQHKGALRGMLREEGLDMAIQLEALRLSSKEFTEPVKNLVVNTETAVMSLLGFKLEATVATEVAKHLIVKTITWSVVMEALLQENKERTGRATFTLEQLKDKARSIEELTGMKVGNEKDTRETHIDVRAKNALGWALSNGGHKGKMNVTRCFASTRAMTGKDEEFRKETCGDPHDLSRIIFMLDNILRHMRENHIYSNLVVCRDNTQAELAQAVVRSFYKNDGVDAVATKYGGKNLQLRSERGHFMKEVEEAGKQIQAGIAELKVPTTWLFFQTRKVSVGVNWPWLQSTSFFDTRPLQDLYQTGDRAGRSCVIQCKGHSHWKKEYCQIYFAQNAFTCEQYVGHWKQSSKSKLSEARAVHLKSHFDLDEEVNLTASCKDAWARGQKELRMPSERNDCAYVQSASYPHPAFAHLLANFDLSTLPTKEGPVPDPPTPGLYLHDDDNGGAIHLSICVPGDSTASQSEKLPLSQLSNLKCAWRESHPLEDRENCYAQLESIYQGEGDADLHTAITMMLQHFSQCLAAPKRVAHRNFEQNNVRRLSPAEAALADSAEKFMDFVLENNRRSTLTTPSSVRNLQATAQQYLAHMQKYFRNGNLGDFRQSTPPHQLAGEVYKQFYAAMAWPRVEENALKQYCAWSGYSQSDAVEGNYKAHLRQDVPTEGRKKMKATKVEEHWSDVRRFCLKHLQRRPEWTTEFAALLEKTWEEKSLEEVARKEECAKAIEYYLQFVRQNTANSGNLAEWRGLFLVFLTQREGRLKLKTRLGYADEVENFCRDSCGMIAPPLDAPDAEKVMARMHAQTDYSQETHNGRKTAVARYLSFLNKRRESPTASRGTKRRRAAASTPTNLEEEFMRFLSEDLGIETGTAYASEFALFLQTTETFPQDDEDYQTRCYPAWCAALEAPPRMNFRISRRGRSERDPSKNIQAAINHLRKWLPRRGTSALPPRMRARVSADASSARASDPAL